MHKFGFSKQGKQKYRCNHCKATRILPEEKDVFNAEQFYFSLQKLYSGLSYRQIATLLKISHSTISRNMQSFFKEHSFEWREILTIRKDLGRVVIGEEKIHPDYAWRFEPVVQVQEPAVDAALKNQTKRGQKPMRYDEYL